VPGRIKVGKEADVNRENKLAIIIGFSLVLVVAVLISDHFSRARNVQSGADVQIGTAADFGAAPAGITRTLGPEEPLRVGGGPLTNVEPVADTNRSNPLLVGPVQPDEFTMGNGESFVEQLTPTTPGDDVKERSEDERPVAQVPSKPFSIGEMRFHDVKKGDALFRLAQKYYGNGSYYKELARYNSSKVPNEASLREGVRLEIPPKDVLLGEAVMPPPGTVRPVKESTGGRPKGEKAVPPDQQVAKADKAKADPKKASVGTYKIVRGDDLSTIAKRLLGDSRRAMELYKLNKDVLEDEHTLIAGTVIKVPAR
jgi:nucleoid-associated protein YgaU